MEPILHITTAAQWAAAQRAAVYLGDTLESEGFIHCSTPVQVVEVANAYFRGQAGLLLLVIDPDKVPAEIRYEDCYDSGQSFPHIYGPLPTEAVIQVHTLPPDADGTFSFPDGGLWLLNKNASPPHGRENGRHISIGDTRLYVVEKGRGYPVIVLHGGPGLDHHEFGDYLDALSDRHRLILVDQRNQGLSDPAPQATWNLEQMARDVGLLAEALGLTDYAVLGHSYGAFVALQHAVDFPGQAAHTIVSGGVPSARFLSVVAENLANFEPEMLRQQVAASWEKESVVQTAAEVATLLHDQMPFHFANPLDVRIETFNQRTSGAVYSPAVLRHFATQDYGGIEVEDRLGQVSQPVLVLAGRYDRACTAVAAEAIVNGLPNGELVVFEQSGHMTYVEENDRYLAVVTDFLARNMATKAKD